MKTSTKSPGDRLRFPVLTLSSVNGVSSIPEEERARHKKRDGEQGYALLRKTKKLYGVRDIAVSLLVKSTCQISHNIGPVSGWDFL